MSTLDDVRMHAAALRGVSERPGATASWQVGGKSLVWERPLTKADLKVLGASAPQGTLLGVRVNNLPEKDHLLQQGTWGCFSIPHFDGYPAVLVRLEDVTPDVLPALLEHAWTAAVRTLPKRQQRALELLG